MSQDQIIRYIIKQKRPVDIQELSKKMSVNKRSVARACNRLAKAKELNITPLKIGPFTKYLYSVNNFR